MESVFSIFGSLRQAGYFYRASFFPSLRRLGNYMGVFFGSEAGLRRVYVDAAFFNVSRLPSMSESARFPFGII